MALVPTDAELLQAGKSVVTTESIKHALACGTISIDDIDRIRKEYVASEAARAQPQQSTLGPSNKPSPGHRVASSFLNFAMAPLLFALIMSSAEFAAIQELVNNMCVWCYAGTLSTPNCHLNWSHLWFNIRAWGPKDPFWFFVLGTNLGHLVLFWTYCGVLHFLDLWGPKFLRPYKIQPTKNVPLDPAKFWKGVRLVLFNQIVISVPVSVIVYPFFEHSIDAPLPGLSEALVHGLVGLIAEEVAFYYGHRLLHHKRLCTLTI